MRTKLEIDIEDHMDFARSEKDAVRRREELLDMLSEIAAGLPEHSHGKGLCGKNRYEWRVWITR